MMRAIPHILRFTALALVLAACEPTWQGGAPVTRGGAAATQASRPSQVTVYSGDTVYSVARRYQLSVRELIEANDLQPPYQLSPGMVLRLPGGGTEHVVQRGDTLLVLARRYKVDFQSFARLNGKEPPYTIRVGERLRLPGSGGAAPAVQTAASRQQGGAIVIGSPNAPATAASGARPAIRSTLPETRPTETAAAPAAPEPERPAAGTAASHPAFQPQQSLPPSPPPLAGRGFVWPLKGDLVAEFGPIAKGQHNDGINIAAPKGTPIRAAENGVVAYSGNELKGFGNLLLIKHADGWMTAYAHADQLLVRRGDKIARGQQIATVGQTGSVSSPQLHFEIRRGTEAVNPLDHLKDVMASSGADGIDLEG